MSNKINVLLITLRSDLSGGPKHVRDQLSYLSHVKDLNLFVAAPDNDYFSSFYITNSKSFFALSHRSFNFITLVRLWMFCRRQEIKIIHSHGRGAGIYARALALIGIKVVHTFHGIHKEPGLKGYLKFSFDLLSRFSVSHYICVSRNEYEKAVELKLSKNSNTSLIVNGIDSEETLNIFNDNEYVDYRKQYNLSKEVIVLGSVTRNDPVKGVDLLLSNFEYFRKKYPELNIVLLIAGDGFESFSREGVIFLGQIDTPIFLYKSVDFYVSNSIREGMPLSVLEAMCCKVPCLLSRVVGHIDLIVDGDNGYLYDSCDNLQFSSRLMSLIESGGRDFAEKSFEQILKNHSLSKMSESTATIYRSELTP